MFEIHQIQTVFLGNYIIEFILIMTMDIYNYYYLFFGSHCTVPEQNIVFTETKFFLQDLKIFFYRNSFALSESPFVY